MRRVALLVLVGLVAVAAAPDDARAACAATVVVDRHALLGIGMDRPSALPPRGGAVRGREPACNDVPGSEWKRSTPATVRTLAGLPRTVAVTFRGGLFVDGDSLIGTSVHSLHAAIFGDDGPRRAGRSCRRAAPLSGRVAERTPRGLRVRRAGGRPVAVDVVAETRIANRPAYEPLRRRQRVGMSTFACGARRVADLITFAGPPVAAKRWTEPTEPPGWDDE